KLQLPHLGEIDVRINLVENRVLLHAVAPQSAQTLSEYGDMLRTSFDASGLTLGQLIIDSAPTRKDDNG
ncbi:MAG: flagellar hook-length control protein FliK, partial [Pusillimonas sp.]